MKYTTWYLIIAVVLLLLSAVFYMLQIHIFHNEEETLFLMLQDLSFVPINVLLVTLIVDRLLKRREKQGLLNKMNMVIGVFYNEIGIELIKICNGLIENIDDINGGLQVSQGWNDRDFNKITKNFSIKPTMFILDNENLTVLKEFLEKKTAGLLRMLANPNLLEHDKFTNMLWAVFHIADELSHRSDFAVLPKSDLDHLKVDMSRAYIFVVSEWASYMRHLKTDYPYLFSIAVRTNPFNPEAEIVVS